MTPFHIIAAVPLRKHISLWAFAAANIMMDIPVVFAVLNETLGDTSPPGSGIHDLHTLPYAAAVALLVWLPIRTRRIAIAALLGVITHLLIDAMYHADVMPSWGLYGLLSQEWIDLLLCAPVVGEGLQWCRAKLFNRSTGVL